MQSKQWRLKSKFITTVYYDAFSHNRENICTPIPSKFHNMRGNFSPNCAVYTVHQGVTKRCRLSLLTNSALVYLPKCRGWGGGGCGVSANEGTAVHITCHGAQINVGDLPWYLTFAVHIPAGLFLYLTRFSGCDLWTASFQSQMGR